MIDLRDQVDLPPPTPTAGMDARMALAAEWQAADPRTAEEIASFYEGATRLADDLDAWHQKPERQDWTRMLVHVARESGAKTTIDIGCGAGHDLKALREALPNTDLWGVEPNRRIVSSYCGKHHGLFHVRRVIEAVPIETADLLVCIDVLEHVVDPEAFLGGIVQRAPIGCLLFETVATSDTGTPLHLKANWGWHPGRVLERHGWECVDYASRVRVWRRTAETGRERASMLLCAYRSVNAEMLSSLLAVCAGNEIGWRLRTKTGDALISRSRSILITQWWRETNDDVCLMVDDDIVFTTADADRLVELCRGGLDIVCGAYPVHDGGHLACRFFPNTGTVTFGPGESVREIEYAATGFVAIHRRVLDALIADLPLCHANQSWSFYPLFQGRVVEHPDSGLTEWLSEDWGFALAAREHGFRVWLDPQTVLKHIGPAALSVRNMTAMHDALKRI